MLTGVRWWRWHSSQYWHSKLVPMAPPGEIGSNGRDQKGKGSSGKRGKAVRLFENLGVDCVAVDVLRVSVQCLWIDWCGRALIVVNWRGIFRQLIETYQGSKLRTVRLPGDNQIWLSGKQISIQTSLMDNQLFYFYFLTCLSEAQRGYTGCRKLQMSGLEFWLNLVGLALKLLGLNNWNWV
jgi:hypothetical protein